jgi:hypothetical protein
MPDWYFEVKDANELDSKIRGEILALDLLGRGDEMYGTVHVTYTNENTKRASLVAVLQARGITFEWTREQPI